MRYLFVCSAGRNRSPTAARISRQLAREYKIKGYEADFSGIDHIAMYPATLRAFDRIFVMSNDLEGEIKDLTDKPVVNLDVQDTSIRERKMRELLERELQEKLTPIMKELAR